MRPPRVRTRIAAFVAVAALSTGAFALLHGTWTAEEIATIRSLSLDALPPLPPAPGNAVADDPRAAELGHELFFDARLSADGSVSCATCHRPERYFTDGAARAEGVGELTRNTPTVVGAAYAPWQFWDGRKDSLWAQALGPLESAVEHGGDRTSYAHVIHEHYAEAYERIFGPLPDLADAERFPPAAGPTADADARRAWEAMTPEDRAAVTRVYSDVGKAIGAYQRRLVPGPTRFDRYARALAEGGPSTAELTPDEIAGLRLFIGDGQCTECHNGPLLTNHDFHNVGVPPAAGLGAGRGRVDGVQRALSDEFNCLSASSDAEPADCGELRFAKVDGEELVGAFKTPTLRGVAETAPYMHAGQFADLREVLEHYDEAPEAAIGRSELEPLNLSERESDQLEAFLRTLRGPPRAAAGWLAPPR